MRMRRRAVAAVAYIAVTVSQLLKHLLKYHRRINGFAIVSLLCCYCLHIHLSCYGSFMVLQTYFAFTNVSIIIFYKAIIFFSYI